jgi:hypothetical protein
MVVEKRIAEVHFSDPRHQQSGITIQLFSAES